MNTVKVERFIKLITGLFIAVSPSLCWAKGGGSVDLGHFFLTVFFVVVATSIVWIINVVAETIVEIKSNHAKIKKTIIKYRF